MTQTPHAKDAPRAKLSGRFGWKARLGVLLFSVAAAVGTGEYLVRHFRLAPYAFPIWVSYERTVYQRSKNPKLGFEMKANHRDPNPGPKDNFKETNSHAQRDVERTLARKPGVPRVLLLGDSVVAGVGLDEIDDTISRQAEKRFGGAVEVLNFGVGGYCTEAEIELLRVKGLQFQPDLVVLLFCGNDYFPGNMSVEKYGPLFERPEWVKHAFIHSALFRMACLRMNWYHFAQELNPFDWNLHSLSQDNVRTGLADLKQLAGEHGFGALVVLWPDFTDAEIRPIWPHPIVDPLAVERYAAEYGLEAVRLAPYFQQDWNATPAAERTSPVGRYTVGDGMHANRLGSDLAGEFLHRLLKDRAELKPAAGP